METSDATPNPEAPGPRPLTAAFGPPEGTEWQRVSPALALYRRLVLAALCLVGGGVVAVLAYAWAGPVWAAASGAVALSALVCGWFLAGRFQRSWGYAEAPEELYATYGVLVRQMVVVPYGRMQVVDVTSDLLEQALGLATVRVRTAASTADTRLVGLGLEEAARLRDRLAARSESFSTGL